MCLLFLSHQLKQMAAHPELGAVQGFFTLEKFFLAAVALYAHEGLVGLCKLKSTVLICSV